MKPLRLIDCRVLQASRWWWRTLLFTLLVLGGAGIMAQTNPAPANPDREQPFSAVRIVAVWPITNQPAPVEEQDQVVPSSEAGGPVPVAMPLVPGEAPDSPQPTSGESGSEAQARSRVSGGLASPGTTNPATLGGEVRSRAERRSFPPGTADRSSAAERSGAITSTTSNTTSSAQPAGRESTSGSPTLADFASFKIISDRNIFDPNRTPRRAGASGATKRPKTVESFTLVGTMSYEKGDFAFFDGSSSNYRKALRTNDSIAGYKLASVGATSVKLSSGQKQVELKIGSQLRREEEGDWTVSTLAETYAATGTNSSSSSTKTGDVGSGATGGADNDVLKRLMQRREQE